MIGENKVFKLLCKMINNIKFIKNNYTYFLYKDNKKFDVELYLDKYFQATDFLSEDIVGFVKYVRINDANYNYFISNNRISIEDRYILKTIDNNGF